MKMSQGWQQDIAVDPYQLASTAQVKLLSLGQQQTPLVLIDHVLADLSILRQQAGAASYATDGSSMYPGLRAPLPRAYMLALLGGAVSTDVSGVPNSAHAEIKAERRVFFAVNDT